MDLIITFGVPLFFWFCILFPYIIFKMIIKGKTDFERFIILIKWKKNYFINTLIYSLVFVAIFFLTKIYAWLILAVFVEFYNRFILQEYPFSIVFETSKEYLMLEEDSLLIDNFKLPLLASLIWSVTYFFISMFIYLMIEFEVWIVLGVITLGLFIGFVFLYSDRQKARKELLSHLLIASDSNKLLRIHKNQVSRF